MQLVDPAIHVVFAGDVSFFLEIGTLVFCIRPRRAHRFTSPLFVFSSIRPTAGHLASSILIHMLCNFMGVPDITFSIAPGNPGESTRTSVLYEHRTGETITVNNYQGFLLGKPPSDGKRPWILCCVYHV